MSIRPILTIAHLTLRNALRTRVFLWVALGLIATTILVPALLTGDGTAVGQMRVVIMYALGIAVTLLILETLWLSAGCVSLDITGKQLQSVAIKPIAPFAILTGKWLGILLLNSGFLAITLLGILTTTSITAKRLEHYPASHTTLQQEVLVGRRAVHPAPDTELEDAAYRLHQQNIYEGKIPQDSPVQRTYRTLKSQRTMVAPGKTISWIIPLPSQKLESNAQHPTNKKVHTSTFGVECSMFDVHSQAPRLSLQYRFRCNALERRPVSGTWTISAAKTPTLTIDVDSILDGTHHLMLPETFTPAGNPVTVAFENKNTDSAPAIFFDSDTPIALLIHESSFAMNLLRAGLATLSILALISAVGIAISTLFSFSVATFATGAILFAITLASGFSEAPVGHNHGTAQENSWITRVAEPCLLMIKHATHDITSNIPVGLISEGMLFSWARTGECILILLLLIPGIILLSASALLSQKELAL
jgi:hypothetical protein